MWKAENNVIKTDSGDVVAIVAEGFIPTDIVDLYNWWEKWEGELNTVLERMNKNVKW